MLGDLLGSLPGALHVGELHHFWGRGLERNWLCGCGERFRSCAFWGRVRGLLGEDATADRARQIEQLRRQMARMPGSKFNPETVRQAYPDYVEAASRLVGAVFQGSGARTIVDSSKSLRHACALLAGGSVSMAVIHLVRDPRASAYSLVERPRQRLDDPDGSKMLRPDIQSAIKLWIRTNREAEQLGALAGRYAFLRYEDLVAEPARAVREIAAWAGEAPSEHEVSAPPSHTISGNPDRLSMRSRQEIRLDDEWSARSEASMRDLVEERTRPWMDRYGYCRAKT